jgi:hypothetical protein
LPRPNYLFLIAVGRSGTTALRKSLGLHPNLCYNGRENNLLGDLVETALVNCTKPDRKTALTVSPQAYQRAFERLAKDIVWSECDAARAEIHFASFGIPPTIENERVRAYADLMLELFPETRVLHLVRDGIQVVASRQLFEHFRNMPFEEHCKRWARTFEWNKWGQQHPDAYRLVRYEWFADKAALRAQLAQIFEWLQIPWHDAPLQHLWSEQYHPTQHPEEAKTTERRERRIEMRSQRWQFWTDEQRATFEQLCGEAMRGFGYAIPWRAPPAKMTLSEQLRHKTKEWLGG